VEGATRWRSLATDRFPLSRQEAPLHLSSAITIKKSAVSFYPLNTFVCQVQFQLQSLSLPSLERHMRSAAPSALACVMGHAAAFAVNPALIAEPRVNRFLAPARWRRARGWTSYKIRF